MKKKKWLTLFCAACLTVSLAGCGSDTAVYVQSVETLMNLGGIAPGDRFQGLVVSENVTQIKKDSDKSVKELLVKEGDDVQEGQALFSYDTEELQLALDKQKLEKEQLLSSIDNYKSQIETLENALNTVGGTTKLQYTIEIQSTQVDLKEAEIKLKTKEAEVKKSEELLENATVVSPIQGRIQTISESGTDQNGNTLPYITIQQIGSYRVKGTLGELQRGGLREGDRVKILSRTDDSVSWAGTVTLVDYENPSQGTDYDRYYGSSSDEMTSSSKYPFYVELDSTDGLMLGQHVYMELEAEEDEAPGVGISAAFVCYNEDGSAYVWAENGKKLEKRSVTLGEYNPETNVQKITGGLSEADYIAYPDPELCQPGAATTHDQPKAEETQAVDMGGA
ncbi:MAG: efflux RND transporter periplasmic adaptor subunit [Oscillospiraceae bacterium]|nr:efflux RND transporter periplasmic adaptor subunit [Oscillospiraceae bacterium]